MSAMSDYLENKLVDHLFRGQSFTPPASLFVALFKSPGPGEEGSLGSEVSTTGTGYARVEIVTALTAFSGTQGAGTTEASSGTGGQTSNNAAITFPVPTGNWTPDGQITHIGVFDAATAGNLLLHGALDAPKNVNLGDSAPSFAAGAMLFTLN